MVLKDITNLFTTSSENSYKLVNLLLLVTLFFYLEYVYIHFISVIYQYEGFVYDYDPLRSILTKSAVIVSLFLLQLKFISPFIYTISVLIKILFLFPNLILFEYMRTDYRIAISVIILDLAIMSASLIKMQVSIPEIKEKHHLPVLFALSAVMLIPFIYTFGFNLNFNVLLLQDVYDVRLAARDQKNLLTGYFYSWVGMITLPIAMIYCISKKKNITCNYLHPCFALFICYRCTENTFFCYFCCYFLLFQ